MLGCNTAGEILYIPPLSIPCVRVVVFRSLSYLMLPYVLAPVFFLPRPLVFFCQGFIVGSVLFFGKRRGFCIPASIKGCQGGERWTALSMKSCSPCAPTQIPQFCNSIMATSNGPKLVEPIAEKSGCCTKRWRGIFDIPRLLLIFRACLYSK